MILITSNTIIAAQIDDDDHCHDGESGNIHGKFSMAMAEGESVAYSSHFPHSIRERYKEIKDNNQRPPNESEAEAGVNGILSFNNQRCANPDFIDVLTNTMPQLSGELCDISRIVLELLQNADDCNFDEEPFVQIIIDATRNVVDLRSNEQG